MNGFIYYFDGESQTAKSLRAMGFPFAGDVVLPGGRVNGGPDTKAGFCTKLRTATHRAGYYPKEQTWKKTAGGWWIGWDKASPPGPDDLVRTDALGGEPVTLRDGHEWFVPILRYPVGPDGESGLPQVFGLGAAGEMVKSVAAEHAAMAETAEKLWTVFDPTSKTFGETTIDLTVDECVSYMAGALALNYYVSEAELLSLSLLDDHCMRAAMEITVDYVRIRKVIRDFHAGANADATKTDTAIETVQE